MTGIVLITYGDACRALLDAAVHILGEPVANAECISVYDAPDTPEWLPEQIAKSLDRLDCKQNLILVDLPGSTHFNIARGFTRNGGIALLTGLNMPMLLRVLAHRENDLEDLLHYGSDGGITGILSFCSGSDTDEEAAL